MSDTKTLPLCDRCGKILTAEGYRATLGDREILLCSRHLRDHGPALEKQKWAISPLVPPDPEAGPKERVRCGRCGGSAHGRFVKASPVSTVVQVVHCLECDTRTCNAVLGHRPDGEAIKCDSKALTRDDVLCPKGHALMPEATA